MRPFRIAGWGVALLTLAVPRTLQAQASSDTLNYRPPPALVKYGKWAMLAGAAGLHYLAARSHNRADDAFGALEDYCFVDRARCATGPTGRYLDPQAEGFYQNSVHEDRKARRYLIAGEATLLGAGALFVWELTRPKRPPPNVPFEPQVSTNGVDTRLGFRVAF